MRLQLTKCRRQLAMFYMAILVVSILCSPVVTRPAFAADEAEGGNAERRSAPVLRLSLEEALACFFARIWT